MELSLILKRVWRGRRILRYILHSVFFNFHYLPFHEAVKLPILLYKPKLLKLKGTIKIKQEDKIGFGMIRLGFPEVSLYPNTGIVFENYGGTVVFKGQCCIGNNSYLSIGPKAIVEFGNRFSATTTFRLTSYDKIIIADCVTFGWDALVVDTDFHKLTKLSGGYNKGHASIHIGSNNWFGNGCRILKRTQTPDYCVIQSGTMLSIPVVAPMYSVIGNDSDIVVKATGLWKNIDDDKIDY